MIELYNDYCQGEEIEYSIEDLANAGDDEYIGDIPDSMIKSFYEKPFGKEYCDLTEEELVKYKKIRNRIK